MRFKQFNRLTEAFDISAPSGTRGPEIADIQKLLLAMGYKLPQHGVDGIMGPETSGAIKQFQTDAGIAASGAADTATVGMLNATLKANPQLGAKLVKSTDADVKPGKGGASKVDTSAIQDPDFNAKLEKVAKALGIDPNNLRIIIKAESGGRPNAEDPWKVSAGLIGFTSQTAQALGTTKEEILKMSAVEQLDLVYKFYKMNGLKPGSDRGTMYMLTFMPAFAYSPDDTVLGQKDGGTLMLPNGRSSKLSMHKVWEQNPGFGKSRGKDFFTVGDVKALINSKK